VVIRLKERDVVSYVLNGDEILLIGALQDHVAAVYHEYIVQDLRINPFRVFE
jgi:hypothetical protein